MVQNVSLDKPKEVSIQLQQRVRLLKSYLAMRHLLCVALGVAMGIHYYETGEGIISFEDACITGSFLTIPLEIVSISLAKRWRRELLLSQADPGGLVAKNKGLETDKHRLSAKITQLEAERSGLLRESDELDDEKEQAQQALQAAESKIETLAKDKSQLEEQLRFSLPNIITAVNTLLETTGLSLLISFFEIRRAKFVISACLHDSEKKKALCQCLAALSPDQRRSLIDRYGAGIAELVNELDISKWPVARLVTALVEAAPQRQLEILVEIDRKFGSLTYAQMKMLRQQLYNLLRVEETKTQAKVMLDKLDENQLARGFDHAPKETIRDLAMASLYVPPGKESQVQARIVSVMQAQASDMEFCQIGRQALALIQALTQFTRSGTNVDMEEAVLKVLAGSTVGVDIIKAIVRQIIEHKIVFYQLSIKDRVKPVLASLKHLNDLELSSLLDEALQKIVPGTRVQPRGQHANVSMAADNEKQLVELILQRDQLREDLERQQAQGIELARLELAALSGTPLGEAAQQKLLIIPENVAQVVREIRLHLANSQDFRLMTIQERERFAKAVAPSSYRPAKDLVISGYKTLQWLGEGSMGDIFTAREENTGRFVIIKTSKVDTSDFRLRFDQEATLLERINHPLIMRVFKHQIDTKPIYYIGEYVRGICLENFRLGMKNQRLPTKYVLAIFYLMAAGLREVSQEVNSYRRGVVHRDLKPEHVFLGSHWGLIKLIDFGVAMDQARSLRRRLTQPNTVLGTTRYLSPEAVADSAQVDYRADIFSMGVIGYEAITGKVPHEPRGNTDEDRFVDLETFFKKQPNVFTQAMLAEISPDRRVQEIFSAMGWVNRDQRSFDQQMPISFAEIMQRIEDIL